MKIYLLDINPLITQSWAEYFSDIKNVKVVTSDLRDFITKNKVECIVSPGNSKGIMNGGYDGIITECFGPQLTQSVQTYIIEHYHGLQPVGSAFTINIPKTKMKLIHCPTMVRPSVIKDTKVIKDCMFATLSEAIKHNIKSIVIPAFGGFTGKVNPNDVAKLMFEGYDLIKEEI